MIRRLTKREQSIAIICFLMVVTYVSFRALIRPMQEKVEVVSQQTESKKRQISRDLRIVRKAKAIDSLYQSYVEKFKQTKTDEQINSQILSEIESVAGELEIPISDLKPRRVRKEEYYNKFSVSLTINSELESIVHFLYNLQRNPHLFSLEEVRFDKGSRRKSQTIKTSIVLSKKFIPDL